MVDRNIFAPGARVLIRDEEWLVRGADPISTGGYAVRVTGMSELVHDTEAVFLTSLDEIRALSPEDTALVSDDSPQFRRSRLFVESLLRQTPPTDDRIYLGHQAALHQTHYQLVPANMALSALRPRILIADGVGIGKTLEVGVLLSELIKRGRGDRILVIALKSLLTQFQQELWARFTIPLVRLDSLGLQRVRATIPANKNPFYYFNKAIISIDTLKNDGRYRTYLEQCRWDVIVIDECHHVANAGNQRSRLAELLSHTCDSLILTSATPHNGKAESFANLMNMLEPTSIVNPKDYDASEIKGLFVRRFKKDVESEVGSHFRERRTEAIKAQASTAEEEAFRILHGLIFHTLNRRSTVGQKDILFKTTLLKAFLSSPQACLESIENRIATVEGKLPDDLRNRDNLQNDLTVLTMMRGTIAHATEHFAKLEQLSQYLERIGWTGKANSPRVIIFSERIRTLQVLYDYLKAKHGLREDAINLFHAGLPDTDQMQIVEDFGKADSPVRVLLATDVASEGVNLHYYCHHLIHFDIPWSLITLEQRNGRIDRYGQEHEPHIAYLLTESSNAEVRDDLRILEVLIDKEEMAHKNIGDASTLLGVHDALKEEEYIMAEVSAGKLAEDIIPDEPAEMDFLQLLLQGEAVVESEDYRAALPSLYENDLQFVKDAFADIQEADPLAPRPDFHPTLPSFTLVAPEELRRQCQFLPREAIPRGWEFMLTADREEMMRAIGDARKLSRQGETAWPKYQLLWELHPVMRWLLDKVMCRFQHHEAPLILAPALGQGQAAYLFQGIMSNLRSQPMVVEWFAVQVDQNNQFSILSLDELWQQSGFANGLSNPGRGSVMRDRLEELKATAVGKAKSHLRTRGQEVQMKLAGRIDEDKKRFMQWYWRSLDRLKEESDPRRTKNEQLPRHIRERLEREAREIEKRKAQREDWLNKTMQISDAPYVKLVAVFAGE